MNTSVAPPPFTSTCSRKSVPVAIQRPVTIAVYELVVGTRSKLTTTLVSVSSAAVPTT